MLQHQAINGGTENLPLCNKITDNSYMNFSKTNQANEVRNSKTDRE